MNVYQKVQFGTSEPCPYLPHECMRLAQYFADELDAEKLNALLSSGWRRFGLFYFRPSCAQCSACVPVRIPVNDFSLRKSQRRLLRKNHGVKMLVHERRFSQEVYDLYVLHSMARFGAADPVELFFQSFYFESCPSLQSAYYLDDRLIGVGFLDLAAHGISSSYFIYHPDCLKWGIGIFSILQEIEFTKNSGLHYYYLGYYVKGNPHMAYKAGFFPHEQYLWGADRWAFHDS